MAFIISHAKCFNSENDICHHKAFVICCLSMQNKLFSGYLKVLHPRLFLRAYLNIEIHRTKSHSIQCVLHTKNACTRVIHSCALYIYDKYDKRANDFCAHFFSLYTRLQHIFYAQCLLIYFHVQLRRHKRSCLLLSAIFSHYTEFIWWNITSGFMWSLCLEQRCKFAKK